MENQNGRMYFRSDPVKYCHHPTSEEKSSASEHASRTQSPAAPTRIKQGKCGHAAATCASKRAACGGVAAHQGGGGEGAAGGHKWGRVRIAHQSLKDWLCNDPPIYSPSHVQIIFTCFPLRGKKTFSDTGQISFHRRPYVGASHARSWSPLLVLGAILWVFIAKNRQGLLKIDF